MTRLEKLGLDNWSKDKVYLSKTSDFQIARVISVNKNSYVVSNGVKDIYAELAGKFLSNFEDALAIIHDIFTRKSLY